MLTFSGPKVNIHKGPCLPPVPFSSHRPLSGTVSRDPSHSCVPAPHKPKGTHFCDGVSLEKMDLGRHATQALGPGYLNQDLRWGHSLQMGMSL